MAVRDVRLVFFTPEINFVLKAPGGAVHKDITKRTFKVSVWARTYAPVRTGYLKSKIKYDVTTSAAGVRGKVTSPAKYTMWVHDGTKPHIIRPKNLLQMSSAYQKRRSNRIRAGKKVKALSASGGVKHALYWPGAEHPVAVVHHPGTFSNPFLTKALNRAVD